MAQVFFFTLASQPQILLARLLSFVVEAAVRGYCQQINSFKAGQIRVVLTVSAARLAIGDGTTSLTLLKYRYHREPLNNESLLVDMFIGSKFKVHLCKFSQF